MEVTLTIELPEGRLARALARLADRPLPLGTLAELQRLDELVADDGGRTPPTVLADQPVHVGRVRLYQPSLGALAFLRQTLDAWFADEPEDGALFLAWVLAHARQPSAFWALADAAAAKRVLADWRRHLGCTLAELIAATEAALAGFPVCARADEEAEEPQTLAFVAACLARYGGTTHGWLWQESAQRALWLEREAANAEAGSRTERPGYLHAATCFRQFMAGLHEGRERGTR